MTPKQNAKAQLARMAPYKGVLAPRIDEIRSLLAQGWSAPDIAKHLEGTGFVSGNGRNWSVMAGLIRHIRRREQNQRLSAVA